MVAIRRYEPDDEAAVVAIWTSAFGYMTPHNDPRLSIARKMAFQPELFFVAVVDDFVVGTVMGGYDGHRGWIYSLAVSEGRRRVGIARALMAHVEDTLEGLSCLKVNLQVLPGNDSVVTLYEELGYVVEPRICLGKILLK